MQILAFISTIPIIFHFSMTVLSVGYYHHIFVVVVSQTSSLQSEIIYIRIFDNF